MAFRVKRSVPVDYDRQGYIYFVTRAYKKLCVKDQERIRQLCEKAGGEYSQAVFEFVTTDKGATAICQKHHLSESTLERTVRKYYILFDKQM